MMRRTLPLVDIPAAVVLSRKTSRATPRGTAVRFQYDATDYAATSELIKLHLSTHYQAAFGEQLKVVGNAPELGRWDVTEAPSMTWTEDHFWVADVDLPKNSEVQFKVVLLSHSGVVWEPGTDRVLKAEPQDGQSAIAARLDWGVPSVQVADLMESVEAIAAAQERSLSDRFDDLWDPTKAGLPTDITCDLETPYTPGPESNETKAKYDVTLEPEWAILENEEQPQQPDTENAAQVELPNEEEEISSTMEESVALQSAAATPSDPEASEELQEVEAPKQEEKVSGLKAAGQAAGYAAAGIAAAVVMSALAVDITDVAIASAVVAAGATFLPSSTDSEGKKKAIQGKGAASPILGAVELGLKAQAMMQGISSKPSQAKQTTAEEEEQAMYTETSEAERLGLYIKAKAAEAEEFARNYRPTEEDFFETSPSNYMKEAVKEKYANNAVSTEGMNLDSSTDSSKRKKKQLSDKK